MDHNKTPVSSQKTIYAQVAEDALLLDDFYRCDLIKQLTASLEKIEDQE